MAIIPANTEDSELEIDQEEETAEDPVELLASFFIEGEKGVLFPKPNIADMFSDTVLLEVGRQVCEGFTADEGSMTEWSEQVEFGLELVKQETHARSEPFEGASNFKSPSLMAAALKFSDRASTELLRSRDLSKVDVTGKDLENKKAERGKRVSEFQNWQLNVQMPEWRDEHEKLLYDLPYTGTVFKKTFFDAQLGRNVSNLVTFPSFVVNNEVKSLERLRRFSEEMEFSANEMEEKIRQGVWTNGPGKEAVKAASSEESDDKAPTDKFSTFIEQQGYFDLDGDGYEEPYTFVVQQSTQKTVRIIPRFEADKVLVKDGKNNRASKLSQLIEGGIPETDGEREIVRIVPNSIVTKYGFLPDAQGGFLDVGYSHLLSALTSGINATTNQLVDAGKFANLQAGWLAKGFRRKLGTSTFKPGEFKQTGISAQDLANGVKLLPFKEPSQTLFALMQFMVANSQELSASADLASALGTNAPATTTLALVQEQQLSASAIILRIYRAMAKEFVKLYELNSKFGDPEEYQQVLDDPDAVMDDDFAVRDMDIIPVANPEISSKIQRIQQAQAELSVIQQVAVAGGDIRPLVKNFFEAIGSQITDEIFPDQNPVEQLQELLASNPDLFQLIMGEKQREDLRATAEAMAIKRAEDREDLRFFVDTAEKNSVIEKNQAVTRKTLEEAESEDLKNQVDTFTAAEDINSKRLDNTSKAVEIVRAIEDKESIS